ncbi:MAG: hypothetical protein WB992_10100 [Bryobacteraceae bacterium]
MSNGEHLENELLLKALDDEVSGAQIVIVESHLSKCEKCVRKFRELRAVSGGIESLLASFEVEDDYRQRDYLNQELERRERLRSAPPSAERVLRRFGWGMAIAATLAIATVVISHRGPQAPGPAAAAESQTAETFEVDGETFVALPYSNPELPMSAPHIVEMQVPVSSLTDAGVIFEPVSSEVSAQDRSVLADVLLGMDGQPLGVRVLE